MRLGLRKYRQFTPFTEEEAWLLFKLAAFAEAAGWTILIIGIFLTKNVLHDNRTAVILAGRTHGILFGIYLIAVLTLAPSLRWNWRQVLLAGLMSAPPYGTLLLEIWISHIKKHRNIVQLHYLSKYHKLVNS
jgi:integral membrane protein